MMARATQTLAGRQLSGAAASGLLAERWIVVGQVKSGWYVRVSNCGFPGGFFMAWRGRISWCQPSEFLNWESVQFAVGVRLGLAGLVLSPESKVLSPPAEGRDGWAEIRVLVRRRGGTLNLELRTLNLEQGNGGNGNGGTSNIEHRTSNFERGTGNRLKPGLRT